MYSFQYLALLGLAASALATCNFGNGGKPGLKQKDTHQCTPRGDGKWTMTMETSLIEVPNPGSPTGTTEETIGFAVYDSKCVLHGSWSKPSCGTPYNLNAGYMKKPLVVERIFADVGSPFMDIKIGGQTIHAECNKHTSGLRAISDCQAHFAN